MHLTLKILRGINIFKDAFVIYLQVFDICFILLDNRPCSLIQGQIQNGFKEGAAKINRMSLPAVITGNYNISRISFGHSDELLVGIQFDQGMVDQGQDEPHGFQREFLNGNF